MAAALAGIVAATLALHLTCCALVLWRLRGRAAVRPGRAPEPMTVLRPVCGLDPDLARTLATTYGTTADIEVIFCVDDADDPAIPVVRAVMAAHGTVPSRLLVGRDRISGNPKLNNLAKGWAAAAHPWIVMIDSNVLLPPDYVAQLFAGWDGAAGLVTSPPAGQEPAGLAAHLEAAFLNTYQDIWQLAGDQVGNGFAQGKVLFWRRDILEAGGGLAALGRNLAEDVAATKVVRAAGRRVRVVTRPFAQPLGRRGLREVWDRQVRWAKVRRDGFPLVFAAEILTGGLPPLLATAGLVALGVAPPGAVAALVLVWYGAQWAVAARAGWPRSAVQVAAWILRDLLIPAVWTAALTSRGFVWRGNAMAPEAPTRAPAD